MTLHGSQADTDQRMEAWHHRLGEVVAHIQPWISSAGGIPEWVKSHLSIQQLIEFMDKRVIRLAKFVAQQQARIVDSWTIAYIERELHELLETAKKFDGLLRKGPVLAA